MEETIKELQEQVRHLKIAMLELEEKQNQIQYQIDRIRESVDYLE